MSESPFAGSWKSGTYLSSRSSFDERFGSNSEYGSENRSFLPPPRSSESFVNNSGSFNTRDIEGSRYSKCSQNYDDEGSSRFEDSGPSKYSSDCGSSNFGSSGLGNFRNNDPLQNYGNDESSNFENSGSNYKNNRSSYRSRSKEPNYGDCSGPNYGNSGPPPSCSKDIEPFQGSMGGSPIRGMRNQNFGNGPNEEDILSSIKTLSQMNAQQNNITTKLISSFLSNMDGFSDWNQYSSSRSSRPGGPGLPSRQSGPPGEPSRFSREGLRSPRITYPGGGVSRSNYDERYSLNSRSSVTKKRSLSSSSSSYSANSKRRRSISKERKYGKRDEDNNAKKESDSEDKEDSDKNDDIPLAAFHCHMCNHGNFSSVKTYLNHLDEIEHRKSAVAFHARNEATLEYLRKNAKLAIFRFGGNDPSVPSSKCTVCFTVIKESFAKHANLLEHKLVEKFMSSKCCSRNFKTRYDMEEHCLSLSHLKKMYTVTEQQKKFLDDGKAKPGKWNHDDIVKQLIARNPVPEKHITLDKIPPFDGNTFIGIKFLRAKDATLCKPCKFLLPVGIKSLEKHMVSIEHYDNVMDYLREKKKRRLEADDRNEDEGEEDTDSDSDDDDLEGNAEGARYCRDHDREDEEDALQVIKLGADEEDLEEKDDRLFYDSVIRGKSHRDHRKKQDYIQRMQDAEAIENIQNVVGRRWIGSKKGHKWWSEEVGKAVRMKTIMMRRWLRNRTDQSRADYVTARNLAERLKRRAKEEAEEKTLEEIE